MKNTSKLLIALLILTIGNFPTIQSQESEASLKVMTYNILNGFDWGKDILRKENWIKWIQNKNPDVLALQELCGYDEEKLKEEALKWGHNYVKILKEEGYATGLTSREPIEVKERLIEDMWHGLLHCKTYGIDFFVVHLSPASCDFRLKEANIIAKKVKASNSEKYIILGDFNAHSPFEEELLKENKILLEKYSSKKNKTSPNLRLGGFDYSVISTFIALPTIDVSLKFIEAPNRYTFPTPILIGTYRKTIEHVIQTHERIDYIFTSPIISKSCTNVQIYNNEETETFSDHYPMMAEFTLKQTHKH